MNAGLGTRNSEREMTEDGLTQSRRDRKGRQERSVIPGTLGALAEQANVPLGNVAHRVRRYKSKCPCHYHVVAELASDVAGTEWRDDHQVKLLHKPFLLTK